MFINFCITGRLGNAIFRYMACSVLCIKYQGEYSTLLQNIDIIINDNVFCEIIKNDYKLQDGNYLLNEWYQQDNIYKKYKAEIVDFINKNEHIVITDGIYAGDGNKQEFLMKNIINQRKNNLKLIIIIYYKCQTL